MKTTKEKFRATECSIDSSICLARNMCGVKRAEPTRARRFASSDTHSFCSTAPDAPVCLAETPVPHRREVYAKMVWHASEAGALPVPRTR